MRLKSLRLVFLGAVAVWLASAPTAVRAEFGHCFCTVHSDDCRDPENNYQDPVENCRPDNYCPNDFDDCVESYIDNLDLTCPPDFSYNCSSETFADWGDDCNWFYGGHECDPWDTSLVCGSEYGECAGEDDECWCDYWFLL